MAMISDVDYILQAVRLSSLRITDDPLTPRIISLDPSFALNPYINASGLSDIDRWPEIKRALDSPPPEPSYLSSENGIPKRLTRDRGGGGLNYTQTIMGGRSGGAGMRVTGRNENKRGTGSTQNKNNHRANSTSLVNDMPLSPSQGQGRTPTTNTKTPTMDNGFFSPSGRPRADSAPAAGLLGIPPGGVTSNSILNGSSMLTSGRGLGMTSNVGVLEQALSTSEASIEDVEHVTPGIGGLGMEADHSSMGQHGASELAVTGITTGGVDRMVGALVDEGSDVDEDEAAEAEGIGRAQVQAQRDASALPPDSRRVSMDTLKSEKLDFTAIPLQTSTSNTSAPLVRPSALTAALNRFVPHLVSTSTSSSPPQFIDEGPPPNPFTSLYATVAAPPGVPSLSLEMYFPHSKKPTDPIVAKVRKDATVEEVTGFGLYKYWEDSRLPLLSEEEDEVKWSAVGWGLRIVEDDGEVDEDFPPLDRESQISKFSYGQFAIVEATDEQIRQNAAKAPNIQRRPSRILAAPTPRPSRPPTQPPSRGATLTVPSTMQAASTSSSFSSNEQTPLGSIAGPGLSTTATAMKGSVGLSSTSSEIVRLKIRVTASADVHFTTTINVPSDMYIADLTEVLCKKKRLQMPATDWVLCLADLTLAIPLDRTVASLEGRTDLALVKRQWATEHGLRIDDRRGGDPSASIFKRQSEPAPIQRFGPGLADFSQTYKKYTVQRKIAIGRHERVLAIDGDYIHIMPSESRAFFDSMKTTSFHITLVASCKLTGRAGGFKINVWREGAQKRYEFEAENQRQASEL
uniref:Sin1 middle CRIM domain-containing protein n=1 Tax=Kwoniella bestiolae CBS 10118 TaxID=1296100 RepID=A0A1B9G4N1_9TREE|nr:hypothetical protein I302_03676 [Kwoniella bestiolae CBS 10118]OCF25999.1 hypothetical protein I302_03676 [Kwoniella bestiolae CBS 10118]